MAYNIMNLRRENMDADNIDDRDNGNALAALLDDAMAAEMEQPRGRGGQHRNVRPLVGLPDYSVFERWGNPRPREECPMCLTQTFMSVDQDGAKIDFEDILKIEQLIRKGMSNTPMEIVASNIEIVWNNMVSNIEATIEKHNLKQTAPNRINKATAYAHIRQHIQHPLNLCTKMLSDLSKLWDYLFHKKIIEIDENGDERPCTEQLRNVKLVCDMIQSVSKNKPNDMLHYQEGVGVDPNRLGAYIATDGYNFVKSIRKRKR